MVLVVREAGEEEEDALVLIETPRRLVAGTTNAEGDRKADEKVGAKPMVSSSRYIHRRFCGARGKSEWAGQWADGAIWTALL